MINGIIIGVLFWQLVFCLLVLFVKNEDVQDYIVGGVIGLIVIMINKLIYKLKQFIKFKNLRSLIINEKEKIFRCKPSKANKLIENGYNFVNYNKYLKEDFPKILWNEKYQNSGDISPNVRYCPKEVWINFPKCTIK